MDIQDKQKKINKVAPKKKIDLNKTKQFKNKYFEFYDDVKSKTHDVYDW